MKKVISLCMVCLMVLSICAVFSCTKDNNEVDNNEVNNNEVNNNEVNEDNGPYVDLGLPSGTKWKTTNEENTADAEYDFFTYDEADSLFGDRLPTKEQWEELKDNCTWSWTENGYEVKGSNGNFIKLPASGRSDLNGGAEYAGVYGCYWSSTPDGSIFAWYLSFLSDDVRMDVINRRIGQSVRLVND